MSAGCSERGREGRGRQRQRHGLERGTWAGCLPLAPQLGLSPHRPVHGTALPPTALPRQGQKNILCFSGGHKCGFEGPN